MGPIRTERLNGALAIVAGLVLIVLASAWWLSGRWAAGAITSAVTGRNLGGLVNRLDASRIKANAAEDWAELVPKNYKPAGVDLSDDVQVRSDDLHADGRPDTG